MKLDPKQDGTALPKVLKQYGWFPRQLGYVRGALRVHTENGVYVLKKSSSSTQKMKWIHQTLSRVKEEGFDHMLPWVTTRSGEPFVTTPQGIWYATPWYGKTLQDPAEVPTEELLRQLARFHRLARPIVEQAEAWREQVDSDFLDHWKQTKAKIEEYREVTRNREFASPFDQVFQKHADFLEKAFSFALQGMQRFADSEGGRLPRYTWVHGRIHPHNLLDGEEGIKWIDFDHATVDTPVRDIVTVFRRFLQSEGDVWEDPATLLAEYESEWELTGKEKKLLALHLAYPERPYRLLKHYYGQGSRRREEAMSVKRLEEELERLRLFQDWVRELWRKGGSKKRRGSESKELAGIRSSSKTTPR